MSPDRAVWRERLRPPPSWWLLGAGMVACVGWMVWVVAPGWPAVLSALAAAAVVVAALWALGSTVVAVIDSQSGGFLLAGRARLPAHIVSDVTALDAAGLRRLAGVDADARAHLVLPPFVSTAVRVGLDDPDDPAPYWLVASRHPQRLAAALDSVRPAETPPAHPPRHEPVTD